MKNVLYCIIALPVLVLLLLSSCATGQASFPAEYIRDNRGTVSFELPEVFELANIIVAVSDYGREHKFRVNKEGAYYREVMDHFSEFSDHPLIEKLELSDENIGNYYSFRNQSYLYSFRNGELARCTMRRSIPGNALFRENLDLIENFASVSGFRHFFASHREYYEEQRELYQSRLPVRKMWNWLEDEFPLTYDHYVIVFSPLIGASHNTVRYEDSGFRECIMFVSGPDFYNTLVSEGRISREMEEALLSRLVFTEIDHNYVNRISGRYKNSIDRALTPLDYWNTQNGYRTPQLTFNEYVTWGLFSLYAYDVYPPEIYKQIEKHVIVSMENRGFLRFNEFNDFFIELYRQKKKNQKISRFFPKIIDWFITENPN